jgi:transposase
MSLKLLAIDLGKRSFHCHGIDSDGVILSRKVSRSKLLETIKDLAPETVAMEAWRQRAFLGPPLSGRWPSSFADQSSFREAFRQGIQERCGGCGGNLRSRIAPDDAVRSGQVPGATGFAISSSCAGRVVCARTALINHMRGLLGEYGVILPQAHGAFWHRPRAPSRLQSFLISRGSSSPTCSMSFALSISGSTNWISSS